MNPYKTCPIYETDNFTIRLVSEDDSEDLLKCYSDRKAQKYFNSDKCTGDFCMYAIEDMINCIKAWLYAYSQQEFIRFSIIDKSHSTAIGTIEMFGSVGKYDNTAGILRVDVSSEYETVPRLSEIFCVCNDNFFDLFEVDIIATKAIPQAFERRNALLNNEFCEGKADEGEHYFIKSKKTISKS
jgi:hypothetical protein